MNIVAYPLYEAEKALQHMNARYEIVFTRATKSIELPEPCFYVIKQHVDSQGVYHLVAAAKVGKEVFNDGL